jgi:hypothetical protein
MNWATARCKKMPALGDIGGKAPMPAVRQVTTVSDSNGNVHTVSELKISLPLLDGSCSIFGIKTASITG